MRKLALTWLVVILGTGVVSCVDIKDSQILYVMFNIMVSEQTQCRVNPDSDTWRTRGIMDAWMTNSYRMFPAMTNYLKPIEQTSNIQGLYGEINNIQIVGGSVSYTYPGNLSAAANDALSKSYYEFTAGYIPPDGRGGVTLPIIPPEVGNALRQEPFIKDQKGAFDVVAHVRMHGVLGDGTQIDSNVFDYPITICWGCLYRVSTFDCQDLTTSSDMRAPCYIGQDDGVDCRFAAIFGWDTNQL